MGEIPFAGVYGLFAIIGGLSIHVAFVVRLHPLPFGVPIIR